MFKIPKFREFDWVFRYFNSVFQNEVKACIFYRQAGGSHNMKFTQVIESDILSARFHFEA